jgi:hypothetical protein
MKLQSTNETVKITWFAWSGGQMFPKTSTMRGIGYDAKCSCGWESRTGGAILRCVKDSVNNHKWIEHNYRYTKVGA